MSGGSKQHFKQFTINNAEDGCLALQSLISSVVIHLHRYKQYSDEAETLFMNTDSKTVPAENYEAVNDKLLYRQHELLKYMADHQSSSFSYIELRKQLVKQGFLTEPLNEELTQVLNDLLDVRNWTFHNPQSMMVAAKDAMEKRIPDSLKGITTVTPQINPVVIPMVVSYDSLMLASLVIHTKKRIEQFESILSAMKSDYQVLVNSLPKPTFLFGKDGLTPDVQYMEHHIVSRLDDMHSDIAQISMAIQKSSYDGTDEKYNDWVFRFTNEDNIED